MGQKMDLWHPGVALSKSGPALATAVPNLAKFLLNRGGRSVGGADEREQPTCESSAERRRRSRDAAPFKLTAAAARNFPRGFALVTIADFLRQL